MSAPSVPRSRRPAAPSGRGSDAAPARPLDHPLASYYLVLIAAGLLVALGLVMVLSASSVDSLRENGSSFTLFRKQAMWFAIGLPLLWISSRMPVRAWRAAAYPGLLVAIALLSLVPFLGHEVGGNKNWLVFGGFSLQPSEAAKLALVVWGADLLARKEQLRMLDDTKHMLVPLLPVAALVVGLVLLGDDLGTSLVLLAIVLGLLFFAGAPMRIFMSIGAVLAVLVALIASTNPTRLERIFAFVGHGEVDPLGIGYQAQQTELAIASGGWWGVGLGASRQKWGLLPQAQNDSIFGVVGEELGLVGTLVVLLLFFVLVFAAVRVALRTDDTFVRLAASGAATWIAFQFLVNVGAALGVLPVIGLPLPLISYGGSALLPTLLAIGMLLAFARAERGAPEALARRGSPVRRLLRGVGRARA